MPKIIDNVKEEVIQKAKNMFFKGDVEALSIRKIAKECNIGMGTVYNYFPSKQDLMKEILKVHFFDVFIHIEDMIKEQEAKKDKLKQLYLTLEDTFIKSDKQIVRNIASMILSYPLDDTQIIAMEIKEFGEKLNDLLKKELDISDDITVYMIVNTLMFFAHNPEYDFEQVWKKLEILMYPELNRI